jgi:hypothetical protein
MLKLKDKVIVSDKNLGSLYGRTGIVVDVSDDMYRVLLTSHINFESEIISIDKSKLSKFLL